ncbi:hypothetical protein PIB30_022820 [Stylosanthes scabra]|uniref:Reverse transcriptase domain-containing protein n=1 Tax=Stylosanthes scabra TaxID=79078 RepID=A0ABU6U8V0_9FABA|nr:hypothetical protein [Stylosanthes scabra]
MQAKAKEFIHHEEVNRVVAATNNQQAQTASRGNASTAYPRDNQRDQGHRGNAKFAKQKYDHYTPLIASITEVYQQISDKGILPRAIPLRGRTQNAKNKTLFCDYHQGYGHKMQDCYDLKDAIEQAIREGKLNEFIQIIREPQNAGRERPEGPETRNSRNLRDTDETMPIVPVITGANHTEKSKSTHKKDHKILATIRSAPPQLPTIRNSPKNPD